MVSFAGLLEPSVSCLASYASINVVSQVYERVVLGHGQAPTVTFASYAVMIASMIVNIGVTTYERKMASKFKSQLLKADSEHTLSDIYASVGVLIAIFAAQYKLYWIDVTASILIVFAILRAGYSIITAHLGSLVDAAILDTRRVESLVLEIPGVVSCDNIRSRGMDDQVFLDLHIKVPSHLSVEEGHQIASAVEEHLKSQTEGLADVVIHVEEDRSLV